MSCGVSMCWAMMQVRRSGAFSSTRSRIRSANGCLASAQLRAEIFPAVSPSILAGHGAHVHPHHMLSGRRPRRIDRRSLAHDQKRSGWQQSAQRCLICLLNFGVTPIQMDVVKTGEIIRCRPIWHPVEREMDDKGARPIPIPLRPLTKASASHRSAIRVCRTNFGR